MANARQLKKQEKKIAVETNNVVMDKVTSGYGNAGSSSERTDKTNKKVEQEFKASTENLSSIANEVKVISSNLLKLENIFKKALEEKKIAEYKKEEAALEEVPTPQKPGLAATAKEGGEKGFFEIIKEFFTNPAVIAAFSGLVYLLLPKDIKEKFNQFFKGFTDGLTSTSEPLSKFQVALISAGAGLATYLGASVLKGVADAISTTLSLITKAKASFGRLKGKGVKGALKSLSKNKAAVAGVAVGAATAVGLTLSDTGKEEKKEGAPEEGPKPVEETTKQETKPPVAGSAAPSAGPPGSAEDPMNADLNQYIIKKDSSVDLEGLNPNLKKRLAGMAKEYYDKTGKKIQINSAYRDPKEQAELFKKVGAPRAAPPGRSKHEVGTAFDMNSGDAATAIQLGLFQKYGFTRPIAAETWHVEPVENRGGSFPDNPIAPGAPIVVASAKGAVIPGTGEKVPESITKPKAVAVQKETPVGGVKEIVGSLNPESSQVSVPVPEEIKPENLEEAPQSISKMFDIRPPETGVDVAKKSEELDQDYMGASPTVVNNVNDNSKQLAQRPGVEAPPPIPSPIANRGTLGLGVKHSSAYFSAVS